MDKSSICGPILLIMMALKVPKDWKLKIVGFENLVDHFLGYLQVWPEKNIFLLDPYPSSKEGKLDFKNPQIGLLKKAQKKVELWQLIQENCDL